MKTIFLLLLPIFIHAQAKQLTWDDFKGKPCEGEKWSASSSTTISWSYKQDDNGCVHDIEASPEFNPNRSWTKTKDVYILIHERGHYNICRIVCEKVFREVNPNKVYTEKEWLHLKLQYETEWDALDRNYDEKTNHSLNRQAQTKWNQWIAEQLKPGN